MMRNLLLMIAALALLSACSSSRPIYSGHEESTAGIPGFQDNGAKKSPYVKLGQSYKVDGEWYVPHFQPEYDETGMASWYGPGFHGGKTANGERFDKHSMTAAHRTLPLPSIVKVTMVSTGKSAYVRINDRGPYAKGRIIDLSFGAAQAIGLIAKGTAKVRVQYCLAESQRYADLLAQGRNPEDIDIASDVLPYAHENIDVAAAEIKDKAEKPATDHSWWDDVNPIPAAKANPPASSINAAPTDDVSARDLGPPQPYFMGPPVIEATTPISPDSPFAVIAKPTPTAAAEPAKAVTLPPSPVTTSAPSSVPIANAMYIQLGTFSVEANAVAMTQKVMSLGKAGLSITQRGDAKLYRVRLGPYENPEMAEEVLARVHEMGMVDAHYARD